MATPDEEEFLRTGVQHYKAKFPDATPDELVSFQKRILSERRAKKPAGESNFSGALNATGLNDPLSYLKHGPLPGMQLGINALGSVGAVGRNLVSSALGTEQVHPLDAAWGGFKGDEKAPGSAKHFHETLTQKAPGLEEGIGNALTLGASNALPEGVGKEIRKGLGAFTTEALADPSTYLSFGGGKAASVVASKAERVAKLSGLSEAAAAQLSRAVAMLHESHAATSEFAPKLDALLQSFGVDRKIASNVLGSAGEFAANSGARVGVPFLSDKAGVDVGAIASKLSGGRIPENAAGRLGEKVARRYGMDVPLHERRGLENIRQELAHADPLQKGPLKARYQDEAFSADPALAGKAKGAAEAQLQKPGPIGRAFDVLNNQLKMNVLGTRPGFHVMNATDDAMRAYSQGFSSPSAFGIAKEAFHNATPAGKVLFQTPAGRGVTAGELRDTADRLGFGTSQRIAPQGSIGDTQEKIANVTSLGAAKLGKKWGGLHDRYSRSAMLIDGLMKGESEASAIARVRETFTDPVMRSQNPWLAEHVEPFFRRAVPFGGFVMRTAENVPRLVLKRPDLSAAFSHAQNAASAAGGPTPDMAREFRMKDQELIGMPPGVAAATGVPKGQMGFAGLRGNPLEDLSAPMQLGAVEPEMTALPIQWAYQKASGKDPLTGREHPLDLEAVLRSLSSYAVPPVTQNLMNRGAKALGAKSSIIGGDLDLTKPDADRKLNLGLSNQFTGSRRIDEPPGAVLKYRKDQKKREGKKKK